MTRVRLGTTTQPQTVPLVVGASIGADGDHNDRGNT
jgi:hypothetical protein